MSALRYQEMSNSVRFALLCALLAGLSGCGDNSWGRLSGTVKLDGKPVGPGTITLLPVDPSMAGAMAKFGEDGKYKIMSSHSREGAKVGEYKVMLDGRAPDQIGAEDTGPLRSPIPLKYSNPKVPILHVTIEPGSKTYDFDLESG